jgi:hypothetical protein
VFDVLGVAALLAVAALSASTSAPVRPLVLDSLLERV